MSSLAAPVFVLLFTVACSVPAYCFNDHANLVGPHAQAPVVDCAVRTLAWEYAQHLALQPGASPSMGGSFSTVFDALRLAIDCNATLPATSKDSSAVLRFYESGPTFYVDPIRGSDSNDGSLTAPFLTIAHALAVTRTGSDASTIVLRNGTFFLPAPILLTSQDSYLTITAYPGETPVISAGAPLENLKWAPVPTNADSRGPSMAGPFQGSILWYPGGGCVYAPGDVNPGVCAPLGKTSTAASCAALCAINTTCTGYTWHDSGAGSWATWCYARLDGYQENDGAANHVCGWKTPPLNVWVASVPAGIADFDTLFINGRRAVRARWPNANPETQQSPVGWASAAAWLPPYAYSAPSEIHIASPKRDNDPWFPTYQWGFNGTVANFTSGSFWGTQHPPAGAQFVVPSGLVLPASAPSTVNWTHPERAVVQAFHGGLWGGWQFAVQSVVDTKVVFSKGGWQEARGSTNGAGFYIENVKELIDVPGEWYFDSDTRQLFVFFNGTSNSTDLNVSLIVTQLEKAITVDGAKSVTLNGLTIAHTLTDYMLPYTVPSGGDWSFHNGAALEFTNTQDCVVSNSVFYAPGGNGVIVSGHNRNTTIIGNEFVWVGASAIVTAGLDGDVMQPTTFPEGTQIIGNHAHETGVYVKQSGGLVYMGVTANSTIKGNVFYNSPRAGINVNDGFGGGHVISNNLAFNHVRETSDHGNFNSWDRAPYIWQPWNTSNLYPAFTYISHNFFINNYHSTWPIDHDDGSNNYEDSFNFLPWGGTKNYLGFAKNTHSSVFLYSDYSPVVLNTPPGQLANGAGVCSFSYGTRPWGKEDMSQWDSFHSNLCITSNPSHFHSYSNCNSANPVDGGIPYLQGNNYASDVGGYVLNCDKATWNLTQAQAFGLEAGSNVLAAVPPIDEIQMLAHVLLDF